MSKRLVLLLLLLFLSVGCQLLPEGTQTPASATPLPATPAAEAPPVNTPSFEIPTPTPAPKSSLIIWLPPAIALRQEAGAVVFSDQLLLFNSAHPDLIISVEQKPSTGQGGILNYLRTGRSVAPTILPDLIALPIGQLTAAADEGLITPLEDLLAAEALTPLYPAAQTWARYNNHTIAYPFAITELPQLEYSSALTETLPLQWGAFISDTNHTMVLPATGSNGAKLALQFYLQAGGSLVNEAGQPMLEPEPLTRALEQLYNGRQKGFIIQQSSNISSLDEGRLLMQTGGADFALSAADEFLNGRSNEVPPGFAAVPGLAAPLPPLVRGWAWAVTTTDPAEKALAVELINVLTTPENLGAWSLNNKILPANPEAFNQWPETDAYVAFAQQELQRAQPMPLADASPVMKALENAVFDVISQSKSPAEAAAEAVTALQP